MDEFELEIFDQTSTYSELRLSGGGMQSGAVPPRGLPRAEVDALVEFVEREYGQGSVAPRVFDSDALRKFGEKLFEFLDGDERWMAPVLASPGGAVLRIPGGHRLRHLPWELLSSGGAYLTVKPTAALLPVRPAGRETRSGDPAVPGNRPLRVLFMATSPEGVEPVLNYEAEEAGILGATARTGTDLVVEESGTLDGLRFEVESYGAGYFDVLHLSGHATVRDEQPVFLVENEVGGPVWATATDLAEQMGGSWPRMVFVSGCLTGNAPDRGALLSMSESLVEAGAPLVLGWALPVGDIAASEFAAHLYQALAAGQRIDHAIVGARRQLYVQRSRDWHLLRVYADRSPLTPMVTPLNTPRRERIRLRAAGVEFLDPQTRISRVATREQFVGRRRMIQRCLRALKQPHGADGAAEALVLHGTGGLGKSTLASRLLERMPTFQRVVWFGRVDLPKFREQVSKIRFESRDQLVEANKLLGDDRIGMADRLRYLLDGPLATIACLFVFDDFEDGNLDERGGEYVLSREMAEILPALLAAIRDTNSASRVVITSRYRFPVPVGAIVAVEGLEALTEVEQTKKIAHLPNLRPDSRAVPTEVKDRAIEAADGNVRLLEWLDRIVTDDTLDVDGLIAAVEGEADRFRKEDIFAQRLLDAQPAELRTMLAKVNVVELPVPIETVYALHDHPDAADHVRRAVDLGLLEEGIDPETGEKRYYVSNVLRPLIRPLLSDDEYRETCAAAARSLYEIWVKP